MEVTYIILIHLSINLRIECHLNRVDDIFVEPLQIDVSTILQHCGFHMIVDILIRDEAEVIFIHILSFTIYFCKGKKHSPKIPKKFANKRNNRYICLQEISGEPDTVTKPKAW
jgi:hypothetical protein